MVTVKPTSFQNQKQMCAKVHCQKHKRTKTHANHLHHYSQQLFLPGSCQHVTFDL